MKAVAYSPDGRMAVAGGDGGTLLTWVPGRPTATMVAGAGTDVIETVAFSPGGAMMVVGGDDSSVRPFRSAPDGRLVAAHAPLSGPTGRILTAAFSPHGHTVAVGSADGSVHFYSTSTWAPIGPLQQANPVASLVFAPDGRTLITGDSAGTTRLWPLPPPGSYHQQGTVYYIFYFDGGKRIADVTGGSSGHVTFWDGGDPLRPTRIASYVPAASFGPVEGAAISPNGRIMAVSNIAGLIQLVDITHLRSPRVVSATLAGSKPYVEQIAFSPDGAVMAVCDDSGQIRLWDVRDAAHPQPLPTLAGVKGQTLGIAFSPTGRLLASASTDDKVRLYDVADPARPFAVAISPSGGVLAAGGADDTVHFWDYRPAAAASAGGQGITSSEWSHYVQGARYSPPCRS